jgi:head-tail adaptor
MPLDAGGLNRRFEIQKPTRSQDAFGEVTPTWSKVAMRWGSIEAVRARERFNGSQVQSEVSHRITIRKMGLDMQPDYRLVLRSNNASDRTFQVVEVFDPDDSLDQWSLEVSEVLST